MMAEYGIDDSHSDWCEVEPHVVLICISLMMSDVEHLVICLFSQTFIDTWESVSYSLWGPMPLVFFPACRPFFSMHLQCPLPTVHFNSPQLWLPFDSLSHPHLSPFLPWQPSKICLLRITPKKFLYNTDLNIAHSWLKIFSDSLFNPHFSSLGRYSVKSGTLAAILQPWGGNLQEEIHHIWVDKVKWIK